MRVKAAVPDLMLLGGIGSAGWGVWELGGAPGVAILVGTIVALYAVWLELNGAP